jgi:hypothetical protein
MICSVIKNKTVFWLFTMQATFFLMLADFDIDVK